jgi:3-methylfumaryl-CoA hydratase
VSEWPDWAAGWTPPVDVQHATVSPEAVAGLAALLDADPELARAGQPLPLLWHWVALAAWPPMLEIGADGHPATGGFMPPTPYPRRMWLGVNLEVAAAPVIGTPVVVERTVSEITEKSGATGAFALVAVITTIRATDGAPLLVETTRFAYRPATEVTSSTEIVEPGEVAEGRWLDHDESGWSARPNPVVLTRYSALTANGHRIHYDLPYATQVERYPNLLVHGPLMATIVAEVARRTDPDRELVGFSCRAQRPYFLGNPATITITEADDDAVELSLTDDTAAAPNLTATVTVR